MKNYCCCLSKIKDSIGQSTWVWIFHYHIVGTGQSLHHRSNAMSHHKCFREVVFLYRWDKIHHNKLDLLEMHFYLNKEYWLLTLHWQPTTSSGLFETSNNFMVKFASNHRRCLAMLMSPCYNHLHILLQCNYTHCSEVLICNLTVLLYVGVSSLSISFYG